MGEQRKYKQRQDSSHSSARRQTQAVRARSPWHHGGERHGEEFKKQSELRPPRGRAKAAEKERACARPVPWLAGEVKDVVRARGGGGEGCAHQSKSDDGDGKNDQAAEQRLCR